ncbi:hypothetical protein ACFLSW_05630 [Candidatus Bipolaricaulota bacterium]
MTAWTALREGFDAFIRRFPLLMGAGLVILACQQAIYLLIPETLWWVQLLLILALLAPLHAGQYLLAVKVVRHEPAAFRDLFAGTSKWGPISLAYLLVSLLTALGFVALIVPGIIVSLMYSFVLIRFLDPKAGERKGSVLELMSESARITKGYRGVLFGIGLLLSVPTLVWTVITLLVEQPISPWIIQLIGIFSGLLFLGPVSAASFMVVYDHALEHPRNRASTQPLD